MNEIKNTPEGIETWQVPSDGRIEGFLARAAGRLAELEGIDL